jgi:hypothetical protein
MIEIPRQLLEGLSHDGLSSEKELAKILDLNIENGDCWNDFEG